MKLMVSITLYIKKENKKIILKENKSPLNTEMNVRNKSIVINTSNDIQF